MAHESEEPDETLLARWRAGDSDAGGQLFERYFVTVFRFFASKVGDVVAKDLAQRTFLSLVESRDRVREGSRMRSFVLTIARNQLFMFLRTRGRRAADDELRQSCADELMPSPASALAANEEERIIVRALRRIPLELQMLIELHYWEELSTEELAELLEIPRGTVKTRLHRARAEVRRVIESLEADIDLRRSSVEDFDRWVARLRAARPPE
ncbi:MAG TPA: RNA polymerase sigma factor [Nannocystaceae bacterium]|nr:RNA polymerase sigma factor [Nannocystaceae bacterium]